MRPGRFDREIYVDLPDLKGREAILKVHARTKLLENDVDLYLLARKTPGFTGADLANLMNEGALLSVRRGKKLVGMLELEDAVERVMAGPEKKGKIIKKLDDDDMTVNMLTINTDRGIIINTKGRVIKINSSEISLLSRDAAGTKSMNLEENEQIQDMLIS